MDEDTTDLSDWLSGWEISELIDYFFFIILVLSIIFLNPPLYLLAISSINFWEPVFSEFYD